MFAADAVINLWDFNRRQKAFVGAGSARWMNCGLRGLWFRLKSRPGRRLQTRFVRAMAAARAHVGIACASTIAWKADNDAGSGESLMSYQLGTSVG